MSDSNSLNALGLGQIDQVGLVVKDLEASIERYDALFGPFDIMEPGEMEYDFRGRTEPCTMRIAFGHTGDMEFELIEWVSGECPHKEFIEAGREGLHHLRYRVPDLEDYVAKARQFGYTAAWGKRFDPERAVAYLERPGDPLWIEFYQYPDGD